MVAATEATRWRRIVGIIAAVLALIDIAIISALIAGLTTTVRLGFRIVQPHDVPGAAQLAALLCGVAALAGWRQRVARGIALVGMLAMLALAITVQTTSWERRFPIGDHALIESYAFLATQGKVLVGPYSRFGWHHPGPLFFWLAAPFYALSKYHTGGLAATLLLINVASVAVITWTARRFASPHLLVALLFGVMAFVWRIGWIYFNLWNPYVPLLPAMALATVCGGVAAGQIRLLPLAVVFASFAAQTHVGLLPYAAGLTAIAIALCLVSTRGERHEWLDLRTRRILNLSAWLLVLLWIGPFAEQLSGHPGNLTQLWRFFAGDHQRPTFPAAYIAWADNIAALLDLDLRLTNNHFVPSPASWPLVWAPVQTLLLIPAALWLRSTGRRFDAAFAAIVFAAMAISLWSVTRVVGGITQYGIVWISAVGVLSLAVLASTGLLLVAAKTRLARLVPAQTAVIIAGVILAVLGIKTWRAFSGYGEPAQLGRREKQAQDLYEGVRTFVRDAQVRKPLLRMSGDTWSPAAAIAFQFQLTGQDFAVEPGALAVFTRAFAPDGTEDVEITLATRPRHDDLRARPGNVQVASSGRIYVDAMFLER